jgi:hypothetical protein
MSIMPSSSLATSEPEVRVLAPREPKLWVCLVLVILHLVGVQIGFQTWYYLELPGKDPLPELETCGFVGLLIGAGLYAIYFRHTWRLTLIAMFIAFALGAATGLAAIVWHLERFS